MRHDNAYFVTFHLNDSLPLETALSLMLEREHMFRNATTPEERARIDESFALRVDRHLDQGHGSCLLREHGGIVAAALKHFHGQRYDLHAWCVMPNHVHAMFDLERGADLDDVLHSWKSFVARRIGKGVIWQRQYFDRVIRSPRQFDETAAYIRRHPARAGLRDWPWVG